MRKRPWRFAVVQRVGHQLQLQWRTQSSAVLSFFLIAPPLECACSALNERDEL
jgi:hypothetical protein